MQRVAVITGGNGYLGTAVTKELKARGWMVAALSRSSQFPCDITNVAATTSAVEKVIGTYGRIDAAIHAAAPAIERIPTAEASQEVVTMQYKVAVDGAKNLYEAVLPHMEEGVFVGITSDATRGAKDVYGGYIEAKQAMEDYLRGLTGSIAVKIVSVGFLPGGLNSDLPEQVRIFFGNKSEPLEAVAARIADACELRQ